jgi:hypothetical protein
LSSGLLHHVVWKKITDVSEVLAASILRAMIASTSEMLVVNFYQATRHNNLEDSLLHLLQICDET